MRSVLGQLGSVKMAVAVLAVMAGVLVYAASLDHELALHRVYRAWWFSALLILLAVNLAASAWVRYPWKKTQLGFVMVHAGIIIVLVGALVTRWLGFEGMEEGTVVTDERFLGIQPPGGDLIWRRLSVHRLEAFQPESVEWNGWKMIVDRYIPHAGKEERVIGGGDRFDPAIHFTIYNERVSVEEWLQPSDPRRARMAIGPLVVEVQQVTPAEWKVWKLASGKGDNRLTFLAAEGHPLRCVMGTRSGLIHRREVKTGQAIETPWMDLKVQVQSYVPNARREVEYHALPLESGKEGYPEAIRLTVRRGDQEEVRWLDLDGHPIQVGGTTLWFQRGRHPLGFSVKLKDFHVGKDPGTDRPASFSSEVEVKDGSRGRSFTKTISMNRPLKYQGYKFFQASYVPVQPGEPEISVLAVARDPGIHLKYLGSVVVIAGLAVMFWWKPMDRPRTP